MLLTELIGIVAPSDTETTSDMDTQIPLGFAEVTLEVDLEADLEGSVTRIKFKNQLAHLA